MKIFLLSEDDMDSLETAPDRAYWDGKDDSERLMVLQGMIRRWIQNIIERKAIYIAKKGGSGED